MSRQQQHGTRHPHTLNLNHDLNEHQNQQASFKSRKKGTNGQVSGWRWTSSVGHLSVSHHLEHQALGTIWVPPEAVQVHPSQQEKHRHKRCGCLRRPPSMTRRSTLRTVTQRLAADSRCPAWMHALWPGHPSVQQPGLDCWNRMTGIGCNGLRCSSCWQALSRQTHAPTRLQASTPQACRDACSPGQPVHIWSAVVA